MFPSFPSYKEGSGGRGQIEPGPPVIELSGINNNTGSIRGDFHWTSRMNSLELLKLSSINKVSLVQVFSCSNTGSIRDDSY